MLKLNCFVRGVIILVAFLYLPLIVVAGHLDTKLQVDKPNDYYARGETVVFTANNGGGSSSADIDCPGVDVIDSNNGKTITLEYSCTHEANQVNVMYTLDEGGQHIWNWDQKDANNNQVPDGTYYGLIFVYHTIDHSKTTMQETSDFYIEKDSDGDGITDSQDVDRDGDGYKNGQDACPDTKPSKDDGSGCESGGDKDKDGVPDDKDLCMYVPGDPSRQDGCKLGAYPVELMRELINGFDDKNADPDADPDGDGIPNSEDNCDYRNGHMNYNGCPEPIILDWSKPGRCGEECEQQLLKRDAKKEGQTSVLLQMAATLIGAGHAYRWGIGLALEVVEDYRVVQHTKKKIEEDPPDMIYKVRVKWKQTPVKLLEKKDEQTQLMNSLIVASTDYKDAVDAYISANEKYLGAKKQNNKYWMKVHAKETKIYANLASSKLQDYNGALSAVSQYLIKENANIIIKKEQLTSFQNELRAKDILALPQEEIKILKDNLGGTDRDVQNLVADALSINPDDWPEKPIVELIKETQKTNELLIVDFERIATSKNRLVQISSLGDWISYLSEALLEFSYMLFNWRAQ